MLPAMLSGQTQPSGPGEFVSPDQKFSLTVPAGWTQAPADKANMLANFVAPPDDERDRFPEKLNVMSVEMEQEADIHELVDQIKPAITQRLDGYKELSDDRVIVADLPARRIIGEMPAQGGTIRTTQWLFTGGTRLYIVTFTHVSDREEKYKPIVVDVINSIAIKK